MGKAAVLRILVPVDGSDSANRAVRHVIDLARDGESLEVHVLNVQPNLRAHARAGTVMTQQMIDDYLREESEAAMQVAKERLDEAGIAHEAFLAFGHIAPAIAEHVARHGCEAIVMGTRGTGPATSLVLGTVAPKVVSLVDVPVTLVK